MLQLHDAKGHTAFKEMLGFFIVILYSFNDETICFDDETMRFWNLRHDVWIIASLGHLIALVRGNVLPRLGMNPCVVT